VDARGSRPSDRYLELTSGVVFGVLHEPEAQQARGVGILFCPPFGWDEICAHRAYLHWAELLSRHGYDCLRIDLPGSGESAGSPRDPKRLEAWSAAVGEAADWLRGETGCRRIVALGIGLGGMAACASAAEGPAIDDLLLWSVPARGRTLLREMRAFASIADAEIKLPDGGDPPAAEDGSLEVAGFVLSADSVAALERLDLTELAFGSPADRRVLLLDRDGVPVDRRLREHLELTASVTTSSGSGYGAMMSHPEHTEMPRATFAASLEWLEQLPGAGLGRQSRREPAAAARVELTVGDARVSESPFELERDGLWMRGTVVEPAPEGAPRVPLCVVLPNAGAIRRIGPNRVWVEASRRWAARGVPTLRLDVLAIGDADGDEREFQYTGAFYRPERTLQLLAALDALAERGIADRFLLAGLCSGAYWGFHASLADQRVQATALINPWWFEWRDAVPLSRYARLAVALVSSGDLREIVRLARSERRLERAVGALAGRLRALVGPARGEDRLDATERAFVELRERGVRTLLLLGYREALEQDMTAAGRIDRAEPWPGVALERIPVADHTFRPVWAQQFVHAALDRWLERAIDDTRRTE
jgi:pimeloyl-ACP methyl ester carboxylesterase